MERCKYNIGEYVFVKHDLDKVSFGLIKSYAFGEYRIQVEEGFVTCRENDISKDFNKLQKHIQFERYSQELSSYEGHVMKFDKNNDFVLGEPNVEGHYITIRVGYGGIYKIVNYWKDGSWMGCSADGSRVIARSFKPIIIKSYKGIEK